MEKVSNIRGPENNRLKIMLQDQSGSFIEATLWEQIAFSFDREAALLKPQPMIIALTSMKVTDYRGLLQLGSTNATTVTVNPNIEELDDIIDRFDILNGHSSTYPTTSTSAISEEVDTNRLTLEELLQKTSDNNVKNKFTCLASIKEIETSQTWFYQSCTECKMRVIPKEERFACPDHGEIKSPRYMCCVNATITDETTSIPVVLFNDVMRIILGIDVTIWLKKKISQTQISYQHHCVLYKDDKKYSNFNCEDKTIKTLSPL
ncbi:hypothetical protein L1987_06556 [Smallanthus sonchifolius]|uniref:Uncharacterized protein n=1 Tax=Smallanthus sonchifolius TaxID=185202 RepID=A0ACB9JYP7_9ASTR|nr:hypothetical protein L1987_06556 [Smallanthus sonchifolius]